MLCNCGNVLIPTPYWVSYPEQTALSNSIPVFIKTTDSNNFKITLEDFKRSITDKTKLLILNSPCNPTGTVYTREGLYDIADYAITARLYLISDEIYEKTLYAGASHYSSTSFEEKFSKMSLPLTVFQKRYQ